ncbi:MAG: hypothetical protein Q9174_002946, partial [Haloplaca sp. 1 TL-2023]
INALRRRQLQDGQIHGQRWKPAECNEHCTTYVLSSTPFFSQTANADMAISSTGHLEVLERRGGDGGSGGDDVSDS